MPRFVPRQRKHKVLARQNATASTTNVVQDSNQNIVIPAAAKAEKEARRAQLKAELRAQQSKISSKKQKRLDKYVETKLKKDENKDYLRRLEKEKEKFDVNTATDLISSKNLNSKKRRFGEFVNGQIGNGNVTVIQEVNKPAAIKAKKEVVQEDDDDIASEDSFEADHPTAFDASTAPETDDAWMQKRAPPVQGTGLAQPLQLGPDGLPIIQVRASKKRRRKLEELGDGNEEEDAVVDIPWDGFSSESDGHASEASDTDSEEHIEDGSDMGTESDEGSGSEEDTEDSNSETTASEGEQKAKIQPRASAFKAWATAQLNQAVGHTPSYAADGEGELPQSIPKPISSATIAPKEPPKLVNGLPEVASEPSSRNQVYSISVTRDEAIQEARVQLPILQREQEIMEAIHNNPVVVIKGDTGSGKTTQIPQFLYEAGYGDPEGPTPGLIGITQPRRVAAVSMAKRVGEELGSHGSKVSHQIRFDSTVSNNTAIKFMTDGILLRELSQDLLLKKYSAIIIDEAHERSVNTDILIGMLSKIVPARTRKTKFNPDPKPLKLIIMSATLNIGDFLNDRLFSSGEKPPIVEAEGRQHRVTTHFALRSRADYLEEVIEKVKRAHKKLPAGGILVFLTGKNEILEVQNRLRQDLTQSESRRGQVENHPRVRFTASETPLETEDLDFGVYDEQRDDAEDEVNILTQSDEEAEDREFDISDDESDDQEDTPSTLFDNRNINKHRPTTSKKDPYDSVHVLPLYSQLPTKEQLRVFEPSPDRSRMIVLATNVAETSLTIPGIRYVFDSGRSKERKYNLETGVQRFEVDYISKASAQQRAGRAGRTGPGHCWRLYTSALYERYFPDHAEPEILRAPAESVVLQVKGFGYPKAVSEFPFPTAPTVQTLEKAERLLKNLGALTPAGKVTELGKQLSNYPLSPRLGKIIASAIGTEVLSQAIALVAGLGVSEIFVNDSQFETKSDVNNANDRNDDNDDEEIDARKQAFGRARATLSKNDKTSDGMKILTAVTMYTESNSKEEFCKQYFLRPKAMFEISQLMNQLRSIIRSNHQTTNPLPALNSSKKLSSTILKQINNTAAAGYIDQIAIRYDCASNPPTLPTKPRRSIDVPYLPLIPLPVAPTADLVQKAIFIHPTSVLSRLSIKDLPQYIVYTHLQQSQPQTLVTLETPPPVKTRMFPLTPLDGTSLRNLVKDTALIEYGKPLAKMKIEELGGLPKQRICWVSTELKGGAAGSFGWSLPPSRVRQVMDVKAATGWRVEEVLA